MDVSRRNWLAAAAVSGLVPAFAAAQEAAAPEKTAVAAPAPLPGALTEESLGKLLQGIGLKPTKTQSRFDFQFNMKPKDAEEWTLSMSAVLSADFGSVWIMAWLDELPKSSRDVPRTALLKMLAENDRMGYGRFFSYIPANRRFALQQVLENSQQLTTKKFHSLLVGLGNTVIETYPQWSTEVWKEEAAGTEAPTASVTPDNGNTATQATAPTGATGKSPARPAATTPAARPPKTATAPGTTVRQ